LGVRGRSTALPGYQRAGSDTNFPRSARTARRPARRRLVRSWAPHVVLSFW